MSLQRVWGVAEDGDVIEVTIPLGFEAELVDRWPPTALVRSDEPVAPVVEHLGLTNDAPSPAIAWNDLESDLGVFAAQRLTSRVAVHAASIAWHGRALLVPATSGAGKSRLAIAAAAAGAQVLSDEYALLDPASGHVTGWTRPVRRRRQGGHSDRLRLATASEPLPVGLVALIVLDLDRPDTWSEISPAKAALGILANTVCAQTRPDASLDAALAAARSATNIEGTRGEAGPALVELFALMDGQAEHEATPGSG